MGGLALGGLLARAGVEVTVLEAHPEYIGGWAHTFSLGGYSFTAGPRYLWNFGPGQIGRRFLDKCGLSKRVPMAQLDRRGFDHIYVGDAEPVRVPNGWSEYEEVLKERFPADARGIGRFFAMCRTAFRLFEVMDERGLYLDPWPGVLWKCFRRHPWASAWVLCHRHLTLAQAFAACRLSDAVRAVLSAHAGIFATPPGSLSFPVYAAATLFYHRGCYYPVHDMADLVGAVADMIRQGRGRVLTNQRVVSVQASVDGIRQVKTHTAETFAADVVVVNFDPKSFLGMTDLSDGSGARRLPPFTYSASGSSLYLGVTDVGLLRGRFGNWNLWYHAGSRCADWSDGDPFAEPHALFVNSPTLVKGQNNDAPAGHATLTAFAPCSYQACQAAAQSGDDAWKERHAERLVDAIERRFVPGLKQHLGAVCLRTPDDKERLMQAPFGNVYGRALDCREVWTKLPYKGLLPNLYFVGAYVSFAGIASVIHGACKLYEELTGERV
jgi:phytoene dehydrogenase-like protein